MRTLLCVCLMSVCVAACWQKPAPQVVQPEPEDPLVIVQLPEDGIRFSLDPTVKKPKDHHPIIRKTGPSLNHTDELRRLICAELGEIELRAQCIHIGAEQVKNLEEPEWYIIKAMVVEQLTVFDTLNGTNHWHRAMTHYSEAIDRLRLQVGDAAKKRIAEVSYYRSLCFRKLGKKDEAEADMLVALAHPVVAEAIKQAEAKREE